MGTVSPNSVLYKAAGNVARQTKFKTFLTLPTFLFNSMSADNYDILCKNITIPSLKNETIEIKYKGHNIQIPGRSDYEKTISLTFILDEKHSLKEDLDNWISGLDATFINPNSISEAFQNATDESNERFGSLTVTADNWKDQGQFSYVFSDLFPISVSGPEFSGDSISTIIELTVEFSYSFYETKTENPEGAGFITGLVNSVIDGVANLIKTTGTKVFDDIENGIFGQPNGKENSFFDAQAYLKENNDKFKKLLRK